MALDGQDGMGEQPIRWDYQACFRIMSMDSIEMQGGYAAKCYDQVPRFQFAM